MLSFKCFLSLCYIRHLSALNKNPQRITRADKTMANDLDDEGIEFPVFRENSFCINVFCYEYEISWHILSSLSCPYIKGAEAICVNIANEMGKCSRLKEMSNFNVLWNFWPI